MAPYVWPVRRKVTMYEIPVPDTVITMQSSARVEYLPKVGHPPLEPEL
jgi:hypothetical protein